MNGTKSNGFLHKLYGFQDNQQNRSIYAVQFFKAAGSNYFKLRGNRQYQTDEYLEAVRRYAIDRYLTPDIKDSFQKCVRLDDLTGFISRNLKRDSFARCIEEFGVPSGAEHNLEKFARSLAIPFSRFVNIYEDEVNNSVWDVYKAFLKDHETMLEDLWARSAKATMFTSIIEIENKKPMAVKSFNTNGGCRTTAMWNGRTINWYW